MEEMKMSSSDSPPQSGLHLTSDGGVVQTSLPLDTAPVALPTISSPRMPSTSRMLSLSAPKVINNRDKLLRQIEGKITRETEEDILNYVAKNGLPLYGGISNEEGALLFLHWLCHYLSYQKMQQEFEYPHSNYESSFATLRSHLINWAREQIGVPGQTYQDRLEIALANVTTEGLSDTTLILDGIHFPIMNMKTQRSQRNYSYKLNRTARGYQIAITQDKIINFVSKGFGGSRYNLDCMSHVIHQFKAQTCTPYDTVLVDSSYRGLEQFDVQTSTPSKKRKNLEGENPSDDSSDSHRQLHSKINEVFTALKNKFSVLQHVFRGPSQRQEEIVLICCALYNNDTRVKLGLPRNFQPSVI